MDAGIVPVRLLLLTSKFNILSFLVLLLRKGAGIGPDNRLMPRKILTRFPPKQPGILPVRSFPERYRLSSLESLHKVLGM